MMAAFIASETLGISLDLRWFDEIVAPPSEALRASLHAAVAEMAALEAGAVANPDEGRMVGHYWLRAPERAPTAELGAAIRLARDQVQALTQRLAGRFPHLLVIGIGGSALGPQLVADALGSLAANADARQVHFLDNTDPDGAARVLDALPLKDTLVVVISKSGRTPETRNGLLAAHAAYHAHGLAFADQAIAITGTGSELDRRAEDEGWLARLPMWDWVGGRTSVMSAVGLLPASLQGLDVDALLAGAAEMDRLTRTPELAQNPALALAAAWHRAVQSGRPNMVILPYKDRLLLLSRYLQQLVMESLGKRLDRQGEVVHEGLTVFGNKGSTDQHAYVQQLRDGRPDFFATFIEVLEDGGGALGALDLHPDGATPTFMGDYLSGFLAGTRQALADAQRPSITLTIPRVDARRLGALIALYERAVGLYASLIDVNAYHQPGVEAGKKAAAHLLEVQARLLDALADGASGDAHVLAQHAGCTPREAFHILRHLAANRRVHASGTGLSITFSRPRA